MDRHTPGQIEKLLVGWVEPYFVYVHNNIKTDMII